MKKIFIASDHAGFRLKEYIKMKFSNKYELVDLGPYQSIKSVNYFVYENSLSRKNLKRNFDERFNCQLNALRKFFFLYPLRSTFIFLVLVMRITFLKLFTYFFK